ncbi:cytochrome bd ubiquinol oxidase subunit I [Isoalcanivorax pacificus W11-5]|uniref:Cytochrome bd ubiquinol oxidase subunit I n=1 Tax=Isoalcanivorax pacificus W11-5 TaxID=391936 RepID=A0A0B4XIC8_9GAMM|nr:cytochrome ubiquinol oxidase subunit I [Isoalcanivorax pacificus]AJD47939.1 cytochrome bd ubiquinol oxidase subunit I [Isoalcanivorax pacificus W11-5]
MIDATLVELSRLQFALTAMYHFLFVPLTLGLSFMIAIMESVYVMTGRTIWRDMTKFWGLLFGINFAMGVATGIVMEFQFGTNWAYYSHYVGDVFGAPLAIEGLMAFFLEATLVGLFFFGWDKLGKVQHLAVTWLVALGSNLSALWILIANGWMQNPVGSVFNTDTMRMEVTNFAEVIFNPVAQAKFVHTVAAGYVTGAMFVLSISAFYLLRKRHVALAKRSLTVAASFGLAAALSVVVLGDESGYALTDNQKMKLAMIEGMWHTEEAPASFTIFGIPDREAQETHYELRVPWMMGLIATRSFTKEIPGILELVALSEMHIRDGLVAYDALETLKEDGNNPQAREAFLQNQQYLGYALMLKRYVEDPRDATDEQITSAVQDSLPNVFALFWSFRFMVAFGFYFILLFGAAFYLCSLRRQMPRWFLRVAFLSLPLPWIAAELGWLVAEYGRQPWVIEGVLPTFLGVSSIGLSEILISLAGFMVLYTVLAVIEVRLMIKYIRLGPDEHVPEQADVTDRPSPAFDNIRA